MTRNEAAERLRDFLTDVQGDEPDDLLGDFGAALAEERRLVVAQIRERFNYARIDRDADVFAILDEVTGESMHLRAIHGSDQPASMNAEVLVVDPPWPQWKGGLRSVRPRQGRALSYPTMPIFECFTIIDDLLDAARVVFLWEIDKYLVEVEAEMRERGWLRHARFVWDKGNGVAPAFTVRFSHEYLVWWYRSPMLPISPTEKGRYTTVIRAMGRQHSRKPDAAYSMVEALYPTAARMDVFSREQRPGWLQWGNEPEHFALSGSPSESEDVADE